MDDVPDRSIEDIERDESERLARVASITGGVVPATFHESLRRPKQESLMSGEKRPVVCVETDEVFPSVASLVRHVNRDRSTVDRALSLDGRIGEFTYKYMDSTAASTRSVAGTGGGPAIAPAARDGGHLAGPEISPRVRAPRSGAARPHKSSKRASESSADASPNDGPVTTAPSQGEPTSATSTARLRVLFIETDSVDPGVWSIISQLLRGE